MKVTAVIIALLITFAVRFGLLVIAANLIFASIRDITTTGLNFWDIFWILFAAKLLLAPSVKGEK